ncbi:XdhC family protein [Hymenobacter sp. J193]|uniref:XdhC family protein n=1 Tax=Hymenobacter sp. J193 TaxID=2898429 RepID=UPI0021507F82|nr:XdhC/CoxI family protein [Hymenobacter sp. J193]MCR5887079.1 XdhC family protein [Hymenobacter sp. J193]
MQLNLPDYGPGAQAPVPRETAVWEYAAEALRQQEPVALLCVLHSQGSSPGRQGFKMSVTRTGMAGSIGGGMMEHKLVELARAHFLQTDAAPEIRRQVHRRDEPTDRSGMICSGEQTVLLLPLQAAHAPVLAEILLRLRTARRGQLHLTPAGLRLTDTPAPAAFSLGYDWHYAEPLGFRQHVTIVGGGHVSLALARILATLDFGITVLEERAELNTFVGNHYAHQRRAVRYEALAPEIPEGPEQFVVLMTFGYRTDYVALKQLLHHQLGYLGVLGSQAKIADMWATLHTEGVAEATLARIHAPVGVSIHSRTPEEIAISIAAELIGVRNGAR